MAKVDLSALVRELGEAVTLYDAKTVWHSSWDRPYRALLALGYSVVALGKALEMAEGAGSDDGNQAEARALELAAACLDTTAGRSRCLRLPDHHLAAVLARTLMAYRAALGEDGEPIALARQEVAKLSEMGRRKT